MMKINQEKLDKNREHLRKMLGLYYRADRIESYKDLFKIMCGSLYIGIYNAEVIEYTNHILIVANYDYGYDHKSHIMTFIYHRENNSIEDTNSLENILNNEDETKVIDGLMELCITMLNNMINPYNNTGDFEPVN